MSFYVETDVIPISSQIGLDHVDHTIVLVRRQPRSKRTPNYSHDYIIF